MGVWGRIKFKYRFAAGAVKGTYRMRYKWGDAPDANESETDQLVLVAATYPIAGDTAAPLTGMTYYLGMNEGSTYGMDDGTYRLRLVGTPVIEREITTRTTTRDARTGANVTRSVVSWQSIGTAMRDWQDERATLVIKAPNYATLLPATRYRARASFTLDRQSSGSWVAASASVPPVGRRSRATSSTPSTTTSRTCCCSWWCSPTCCSRARSARWCWR